MHQKDEPFLSEDLLHTCCYQVQEGKDQEMAFHGAYLCMCLDFTKDSLAVERPHKCGTLRAPERLESVTFVFLALQLPETHDPQA